METLRWIMTEARGVGRHLASTARAARTSFALAAGLALSAPAMPALAQTAEDEASTAEGAPPAAAAEFPPPEWYSLHGEITNVTQYHPSFNSPYRGTNSLNPGNRSDETVDALLFAGMRLSDGLEFYANPEVDQGFGLSNTLGIAGFPNGEAYKIGSPTPYIRLSRAFFRYTLGLGGAEQKIEPGQNQLGGTRLSDNLVVTVGKFSVIDIFDTNTYAHDPTVDFLNWSIIDAGAFDYAADAWGYTYGGAAEWTRSWWTLRAGLFALSRVPNSKYLDRDFGQFSVVTEAEERHELLGNPGKLKILLFANRGRMANYTAAVRLAEGTGKPPEVAAARRYATRPGAAVNLEQQLAPDLGMFARASLNDGQKETYEFTDINRSISGGFSLKGERWQRPDDTVGLAGVVNGISNAARQYFNAGGLGILIGDGRLPHYGFEKILEFYYSAAVAQGMAVTFDYQHVDNPAYNPDRGPVSIFGVRLHAEF